MSGHSITAKFEIGQRLWYVPGRWRDQHEVKIDAVGRLYLTMANGHKIRKDTLRHASNRGGLGRYWLNREGSELEAELLTVWSRFRERVARAYQPPAADAAKIRQAAEILGFDETALEGRFFTPAPRERSS